MGAGRMLAKFSGFLTHNPNSNDSLHSFILLGLGLVFSKEYPCPNHHCLAFGFRGNV